MTSKSDSLDDAKKSKERRAKGYSFSDGGYQEVEWMHFNPCIGCEKVVRNILDYAKWARTVIQ